MKVTIGDSKIIKLCSSEEYNYFFDKRNGMFSRWGKTEDDDPLYSPIGPEILDCEITTKCSGVNGIPCSICYKSNDACGKNMSFDTFKRVIDKVNKYNQLTQVALGLDSTGEENNDVWKMCKFLREERGIIPNGTVANISNETADRIAMWFGACSVSYHGDKDVCCNSVKKLVDSGMNQVNIHFVLSKESMYEAITVMSEMCSDYRLRGLNAIVFLSLKKIGRAKDNGMEILAQDEFDKVIDYAQQHHIRYGMDSCSACKYLKYIDTHKDMVKYADFVEPCESFSVFSAYVSVDAKYYPCSFAECETGWENGFDVLGEEDFVKDIWNSEKMIKAREKSLECNRNCLLFEV